MSDMEALEAIEKILKHRQFSRTIITHDHSQHHNYTAADIRSCGGMDSSLSFSTVARCWLIVDLISCMRELPMYFYCRVLVMLSNMSSCMQPSFLKLKRLTMTPS